VALTDGKALVTLPMLWIAVLSLLVAAAAGFVASQLQADARHAEMRSAGMCFGVF
jgi:hypothetical protein